AAACDRAPGAAVAGRDARGRDRRLGAERLRARRPQRRPLRGHGHRLQGGRARRMGARTAGRRRGARRRAAVRRRHAGLRARLARHRAHPRPDRGAARMGAGGAPLRVPRRAPPRPHLRPRPPAHAAGGTGRAPRGRAAVRRGPALDGVGGRVLPRALPAPRPGRGRLPRPGLPRRQRLRGGHRRGREPALRCVTGLNGGFTVHLAPMALSAAERPYVSQARLLPAWRLAIVGALIALAAVAWWATDLRMAGMDAGPGTDPGAFGFYITTW